MEAEKSKIVYSGMDNEAAILARISARFNTFEIPADEIEINQLHLSGAVVYMLGTACIAPVNHVQKIYATDKHISIIILAETTKLQQVKQSLQFAPNVGKNAVVVPVNAQLEINQVCESAATRTLQKRSFARLNLQHTARPAPEKVRVSQMGSFLENAPVGALMISPDKKVVNYNPAAIKLFSPIEVPGADINLLFTGASLESLRIYLDQPGKVGNTIDLQINKRIVEASASSVYEEDGKEYRLLLLNDVTDQRQEKQRIQSVLEALPQMAFVTNAAGATFYFNRGWYHFTGQQKADALGWGWSAAVHPSDIAKLTEQWKLSLSKGVPLQYAVRYRGNNGSFRWHLTRATPVRNPASEIIMWVGTCTDIHDQVMLTEELEQKVKERTATLQAINAELEQFAHVSSHDLQEPLRKIRTFSELLKDNAYDLLDESAQRYLDKINSTAERMSNSLKALLNYTRMQKHERFTAINLDELVNQVLTDLELMIQQKQAMINKSELPVIYAAPVQMQQLFYNLINNALKFSRPGVAPVITITSETVPGAKLVQRFPHLDDTIDYCEILVSDNGIGFGQQYADKIFSIFQRLHRKTEYEGTGIGLSLVKRVVQNHKGEVYAVAEEGKGAAFHILLPGEL